MRKVIVIGAGASGLMAAGQAGYQGAEVLLLEKMSLPGKKILISGKGRCNLTNQADKEHFLDHFNRGGRFLRQPFSRFFINELIHFFEEQGVKLVTERGGRVFPASGNSSDIVDALLRYIDSQGGRLQCAAPLEELLIKAGKIIGVRCHGKTLNCDAVVIACGGASYPSTGSSGDGYSFAKAAGHTITPVRPALIPLLVDDPMVHRLAGLDLKNIGIRICCNGKRKKTDFGEVGFTRFGIGGPVILTNSLFVVDSLNQGQQVTIALDLKPALDEKKLDNRLLRDLQQRCHEKIGSVLGGLLPRQLIPAALHFCSIDAEKAAGQIRSEERGRLRAWLKDFRLAISGHRPLAEAIVTAGGVRVNEVNPYTMESRKTKGLYLAGELLDINGDTGGYNLQAAFSTGWLAGRSAALDNISI
jgi:predicted Rossmann fold flavoprotein